MFKDKLKKATEEIIKYDAVAQLFIDKYKIEETNILFEDIKDLAVKITDSAISLIADELPEDEEHSKDCIYVIEPRYFGHPAKEKHCTCGAYYTNQALKEVKKQLGI